MQVFKIKKVTKKLLLRNHRKNNEKMLFVFRVSYKFYKISITVNYYTILIKII